MSSILRIFFVKYYCMYEKIAAQIKEIRLSANLSQSDFGKSLSVSQDTVSLWEHGKSLPTTELVIAISKTYDVSADYILGLSDY